MLTVHDVFNLLKRSSRGFIERLKLFLALYLLIGWREVRLAQIQILHFLQDIERLAGPSVASDLLLLLLILSEGVSGLRYMPTLFLLLLLLLLLWNGIERNSGTSDRAGKRVHPGQNLGFSDYLWQI